jgi:tetratricopeptide (TPR) repeat protein
MLVLDGLLSAAGELKDEGNSQLNDGDFEEAFNKYEDGLRLLDGIQAGVLAPVDQERVLSLRVPLLLNSVLCDLRMNPEEQTRRLAVSEQRIAEVLQAEPTNLKALFRQAQLAGRAGEFTEAKTLLERLCRQEPAERAFRTELASVNARIQAAKQETAAFWSTAVKRTLADADLEVMEGGMPADDGEATDVLSGRAAVLVRVASAVLQWMLNVFGALRRRVLFAVYGLEGAARGHRTYEHVP